MKQSVFDGPVGASEGEQALWAGLVRRQACDEISGLDALAPADLPSPLKPRDLCQTRPIEIVGSLAGKMSSPEAVDAPDALVHGLAEPSLDLDRKSRYSSRPLGTTS